MVEMEDVIGSKILNIYNNDETIEMVVDKDGRQYRILCQPSIDATFDDCTINDEECYDLLIVCRVEEVEEG